MATLEIHDGRGEVRYLTISKDTQVLFGADPKCEIVLGDPAAMPIHGRIRWRNGRYKVEATPEAQALEVDGKRVVSSSFRQGSEVRVGSARIFLVTPDDGAADFEKTRVQNSDAQGVPGWAGRAKKGVMGAEVAPPSAEGEFDDVNAALANLAERPSQEAPQPLRRRRSRDEQAEPVEPEEPAEPPLKRLLAIFAGRDRAPGEERVFSSPIILALLLVVVIIAFVGVGLYSVIVEMSANRAFARADEAYQEGRYRDSIGLFNAYGADYPRHKNVPRARVLAGLAEVRQFTSGSPAYAEALKAAEEVYDRLRQMPAFDDFRADLASDVLGIARGLADRAERAADAEALDLAEQAAALHDRVGRQAAAEARDRVGFPEKIAEARAAVRKAAVRAEGIAEMDQALEANDAVGTYEARNRLALRYADLGSDPEVLDRLMTANELIKADVAVDRTSRPAAREPRPDPLGPPTALVLRTTDTPAAGGPLAYALADGFAYAVDATTGAPVWQVPIGLDSPFPPIAIKGGDGDVLAVDSRSNELVRLRGRDGSLAWRQELGEAVVARPLLVGSQVVQPTPSGRLVLLNLTTGELQATITLDRPIASTPIADDSGKYYYVLGHDSIVFVISRETLGCASVAYTGHAAGSVICPPLRLGDYMLLAENSEPESGRWSIFRIGGEGLTLELLQRAPISGWTWDTPSTAGQVVWSATDRGSVAAFAIVPDADADPLSLIARITPEGARIGPTYTFARTERELWVASSRSARHDLDIEGARLSTAWTLNRAGPALAPPQVAGGAFILTQQPDDGPGAALWCVEPRDGSVKWRTILGRPWPARPAPADGGAALASIAGDGAPIQLSPEQLAAGGFVTEVLPQPGVVRPELENLARLDLGDAALLIPEGESDHVFLRLEDSSGLDQVDLPAPLAAPPILWRDALLVPGVDGRVYLVDPRTGAPAADPLLTTFDRDDPIRWLAPVALDDGAVVIAERDGTLRRLVLDETDRPQLSVTAEVTLDRPPAAPPGSTGDSVILVTADNRLRALSSRDLSASGTVELAAPLAAGPFSVPDRALVMIADTAGTLLAVGPGGERRWSIDLGGAALVGEPAVVDDAVDFLTLDGVLHRHALSDGAEISRLTLDPLPAGGPVPLGGGRLAIPVAPGTVRAVTDGG